MDSERDDREAVEADRTLPKGGGEEMVREATPDIRPEDAMMYCPVCSTRLQDSRCKLVCKRCGYYMSCADFY